MILMLIVVVYHCILFWAGNWFVGTPVYASEMLKILSEWLNSFHIYCFTLVSGYIFFALRYEFGKYQKFSEFITNKAKRLLIPYVFTAIIWVIPISTYFFNYGITDIITKYVLAVSPGQLWFLFMLFDVFVIFWLLSNFVKEHDIISVIIIVIFYCVGIAGQAIIGDVFQVFRACSYLPFFWIGFKIRQHGSRVLLKIPVYVWIIADIILFFTVQWISSIDNFMFKILKLGGMFMLHIVGAVMAFVMLQKLAKIIHWKERKLFVFLSKNSMPVYLFHQQVVYILVYVLNGVVNPYINAFVNFIGAMIVSLIISLVLMKFKLTKALIGEK